MAAKNDLPFERGQTYYRGQIPLLASGAINYEAHKELLGKTYEIEDYDFGSTENTKPFRTGGYVKLMVVQNLSATSAKPKDLQKMKITGTVGNEFVGQVLDNAPTVGDQCFPADEFLPAAGAVQGDIFYVVVGGVAKVKTDTAGDTTIDPGEHVICGATTAGRVIGQDTTVAAGAATFAQINGAVGICIDPVAAVSTDFLIYVFPKRV